MYRYPVLVMHGAKDPIVPVRSSVVFYEAIASDDKTLKIYDDQFHDLLRVKAAPEIVAEMVAWCDNLI